MTPSSKGVAEGDAISTRVRIGNAVADPLGVAEISLPLTPACMLVLLRRRHRRPA